MNKTLWIILGVGALSVAALVLLREILFPFIAALAIGYFLHPVCCKLESLGLRRGLAPFLLVVLFFIFMALAIGLIVPPLYRESMALLHELPTYWAALGERFGAWRETALAETLLAFGVAERGSDWVSGIDLGSVGRSLFNFVSVWLKGLGSGVATIFNIVALCLITPLVSFYLLRDWDSLTAHVESLIPRRYRDTVLALLRDMDRVLSAYVRGQLIVCLLLGVLLGVALSLVGLPYGFVIGFLSGLLSIIPYLGQLLGLVIAVIVGYATSLSFILPFWVILIYGVGNMVESFLLTPRLVGSSIGLSAVWVIFALSAGASLLGFLGMFLALPVAACLSVLLRFVLAHYRAGSFYTGA